MHQYILLKICTESKRMIKRYKQDIKSCPYHGVVYRIPKILATICFLLVIHASNG